jgi:hypothetical protein
MVNAWQVRGYVPRASGGFSEHPRQAPKTQLGPDCFEAHQKY